MKRKNRLKITLQIVSFKKVECLTLCFRNQAHQFFVQNKGVRSMNDVSEIGSDYSLKFEKRQNIFLMLHYFLSTEFVKT